LPVEVSREHLTAAVRDALVGAGVPPPIAVVEAGVMVDADLCGVPSHGVLMLPRLLAALRDGRAAASPAVTLVRDHSATCVLDGANGPGRYISICAMDHAVAKARALGIGACLAVRTTHWGRAHAYAVHAARQGVIGLCTTNAIPTLAPAGATHAILGNNPLAIAVPRGEGADPLVLDIAMTQAAFGKVATWRREGRTVPPDWGFDANGRPTDDAATILASGMLSPMGGHKGLGLALMMELLTAGLANSFFGHEIVERDRSGVDPDASKFFIAIDPGAFGDAAAFARRVDELVTWIKSTEADEAVLAPGERGWTARAHHLAHGIPLHDAIVQQLAVVGVKI
jgi:LDH2 family malate/lactate/ureidoglycolate dehydrogenase